MSGHSFDGLAADLCALLARGVGSPLTDDEFNRWALRVFRWQVEHNPAYRGYCEGRDATPASVTRWEEIPPVPTSAFKHLRLLSVEPGRAPEASFRTSGTTRGAERRGEHAVASLALYRAALLPTFRAYVVPDVRPGARLPVLALVPSAIDAPHSSLSYMITTAIDELGDARSRWLAAADGDLDGRSLLGALGAAENAGRPVLIVATAFALVHALDLLGTAGARFRLPEGSRLMETGGFKGRSRTVDRATLYAEVETALGIPARMIVNEYGMTELLSQFYEPVLSSGALASAPLAERFHVAPPWLRASVLDPVTLTPLAEGRPGLLCHLDLANAGSVACVLTEDLGVAVPGGIRVLGRVAGAEPRGCSLAAEELLRAAAVR
jgi:hypothetical protein